MWYIIYTFFCLQTIFFYSAICQQISNVPGISSPNFLSNPNFGYAPGVNTGSAPNIVAALTPNLASEAAAINSIGMTEFPTPLVSEVTNGYSGLGVGNVAVAGEMPVAGASLVSGQVPVTGTVRFSGEVPASGIISVSATCGCGLS